MRSGLAARIAFQIVQRQQLIALRRGTDVVDVLYPFVASSPEVFEDTGPAAHDGETHDLRVILIFPQLRKDGIGILFRCLLHDRGVLLRQVGAPPAQEIFVNIIGHIVAADRQQLIGHADDALLDAQLVRIIVSATKFTQSQ